MNFDVKNITGNKQQAIASAVADALTSFCNQEPELEQAIEQSGKTFQACLDYVVKIDPCVGVEGSENEP